ncbi:HPP family protein [Longibacter salinarum]|uniref:HPP family protein n=1 Tax=Longibacter salinarum TaxID=1850348 RepID=A0A2A8CY33_9BACT|nr:HPP family protein [Longibacter salinarum]PEN13639.1 HPP family protein [Longibacter salinarum]
MLRRAIYVGVETGLLLCLLGTVTWVSGYPFIFPSLGPTAFVLAMSPDHNTLRQVVGGHVCGVLSGLAAYHLLAFGLVVTVAHDPFSTERLWLAASGAFSVAMTAGSMIGLRVVHPPACATTLIVSLGLMSGIVEAAIIVVAVSVLYAAHRLIHRLLRSSLSATSA